MMTLGKRVVDSEYSETEIKANREEPIFNKDQLVKSKTYKDVRDILGVVLKEDKQYTHSEVKRLIEEFKGRVI